MDLAEIRSRIKELQQQRRDGRGDGNRITLELAELRIKEDAAWRESEGLAPRDY